MAIFDDGDFDNLVIDDVTRSSHFLCNCLVKWFEQENCEDGWYYDTRNTVEDFMRVIARKLGFLLDDEIYCRYIVEPSEISSKQFDMLINNDGDPVNAFTKETINMYMSWFGKERPNPEWITQVRDAYVAMARIVATRLDFTIIDEKPRKKHRIETSDEEYSRGQKTIDEFLGKNDS